MVGREKKQKANVAGNALFQLPQKGPQIVEQAAKCYK